MNARFSLSHKTASDEEKDLLRPVDTFQTEGLRQHSHTAIIQSLDGSHTV
jgi:hypothetical protein